MLRGLRKAREISDTKIVSVAVLVVRAGKVRMIVKGVSVEFSQYILVYVSGGMKSNTPPHPEMSPSPSTILLKGSRVVTPRNGFESVH
jgi:hypothetical protein